MEKGKHISLDEIGNKLPFTVPENYFNQFAGEFEAQIAVKPVSVIKLLRPWFYMAAMFVGIFIVGQFFYSLYQDKKIANNENYELYVMSQVDETELIDYYLSENN